MKREPFNKLFKDKTVLREMLRLRRKGWHYATLGLHFGCDHTSIRYQCIKHKVYPSIQTHYQAKYQKEIEKERMKIKGITHNLSNRKRKSLSRVSSYTDLAGEKVNRGMSYKDYLEIDEKRNHIKR